MGTQLALLAEATPKPRSRDYREILTDIRWARSIKDLDLLALEDMTGLTADEHRQVVEQVVIQARTLLKVARGDKHGVWTFGFIELDAEESSRFQAQAKRLAK